METVDSPRDSTACLEGVPEDVVQYQILPFLGLLECLQLTVTARTFHFLISTRCGGTWPAFCARALNELQRMNQMNIHEEDAVLDDSSLDGSVVESAREATPAAADAEDRAVVVVESQDDNGSHDGEGAAADPRDDPRDSYAFRRLPPRVQVRLVLDFTKQCVGNLWELFSDGILTDGDDLELLCDFNFSGRDVDGWWGQYADGGWFSRGMASVETLHTENPRRCNLLLNVVALHLADWDLKKTGNSNGPWELHRSAFYGIAYDAADCRYLNTTFDELVFQQDDSGNDLKSAPAKGSDEHIRQIVGSHDAVSVALFGASWTSRIEVLGKVRDKLDALLVYCDSDDPVSSIESV
jgi:hypothetical protein